MRKMFLLLIAVLSVAVFCGEKTKLSSVLGSDIFKKGFSATVKTTSDVPMMPVQEPYTVYTDSEGNSRTDMKDNVSLYIEENGKDMIYNFDKKTKSYTVFCYDDLPGSGQTMEKPGEFEEEELVEKVGTEMFAGVKCDKYKVIVEESADEDDDEEEMKGESYIFVDPAKKMFVGMEMKVGPYSMKTEYTNIKHGVDKEMFKPLPGYKKVEGFPAGGFNR